VAVIIIAVTVVIITAIIMLFLKDEKSIFSKSIGADGPAKSLKKGSHESSDAAFFLSARLFDTHFYISFYNLEHYKYQSFIPSAGSPVAPRPLPLAPRPTTQPPNHPTAHAEAPFTKQRKERRQRKEKKRKEY
jgi:hypothetical protein